MLLMDLNKEFNRGLKHVETISFDLDDVRTPHRLF